MLTLPSHPTDEKLKNPESHLSHLNPVTPGLQLQPKALQDREMLPSLLHWQAGDRTHCEGKKHN